MHWWLWHIDCWWESLVGLSMRVRTFHVANFINLLHCFWQQEEWSHWTRPSSQRQPMFEALLVPHLQWAEGILKRTTQPQPQLVNCTSVSLATTAAYVQICDYGLQQITDPVPVATYLDRKERSKTSGGLHPSQPQRGGKTSGTHWWLETWEVLVCLELPSNLFIKSGHTSSTVLPYCLINKFSLVA